MKFIPVQSSMLDAIAYNPNRRRLVAQFKAKGEAEPSYYLYHNVDSHTVALILFAESVGQAFGRYIKGNPDSFPYRKLTTEEAFAEE